MGRWDKDPKITYVANMPKVAPVKNVILEMSYEEFLVVASSVANASQDMAGLAQAGGIIFAIHPYEEQKKSSLGTIFHLTDAAESLSLKLISMMEGLKHPETV